MTYEYVHGVETELKKLAEFPVKVEKNVTRGAVRAAARVVQQAIAPRVPRKSGDLAATLRVSTRLKGKVVSGAVKIGNRRKGVFYAGFVMSGTKPHQIKAKVGGALGFGGLVRQVVQHPGAKAQPFMNEADAVSRDAAIRAAFEYADGRVRKIIADQQK
jgi:HK97 gp10 family phage protein